MSFVPSFFSGILCLSGLFIISLVIVVGFRTIEFFIKEHFLVNPTSVEKPPPRTIKRKRKKSYPSPVRSIEIDPQEVDRIYVKKAN